MQPSFHFKVVTPKGLAYEADIVHASLPDERGFVGVLSHHAPFVTSSPGGRLTLKMKDGSEKKYEVGSGFFEVASNQAVLLTNSFQES